ncbi:hypothetical protein KIPB_003310, partial [Kipferlia bialata]
PDCYKQVTHALTASFHSGPDDEFGTEHDARKTLPVPHVTLLAKVLGDTDLGPILVADVFEEVLQVVNQTPTKSASLLQGERERIREQEMHMSEYQLERERERDEERVEHNKRQAALVSLFNVVADKHPAFIVHPLMIGIKSTDPFLITQSAASLHTLSHYIGIANVVTPVFVGAALKQTVSTGLVSFLYELSWAISNLKGFIGDKEREVEREKERERDGERIPNRQEREEQWVAQRDHILVSLGAILDTVSKHIRQRLEDEGKSLQHSMKIVLLALVTSIRTVIPFADISLSLFSSHVLVWSAQSPTSEDLSLIRQIKAMYRDHKTPELERRRERQRERESRREEGPAGPSPFQIVMERALTGWEREAHNQSYSSETCVIEKETPVVFDITSQEASILALSSVAARLGERELKTLCRPVFSCMTSTCTQVSSACCYLWLMCTVTVPQLTKRVVCESFYSADSAERERAIRAYACLWRHRSALSYMYQIVSNDTSPCGSKYDESHGKRRGKRTIPPETDTSLAPKLPVPHASMHLEADSAHKRALALPAELWSLQGQDDPQSEENPSLRTILCLSWLPSAITSSPLLSQAGSESLYSVDERNSVVADLWDNLGDQPDLCMFYRNPLPAMLLIPVFSVIDLLADDSAAVSTEARNFLAGAVQTEPVLLLKPLFSEYPTLPFTDKGHLLARVMSLVDALIDGPEREREGETEGEVLVAPSSSLLPPEFVYFLTNFLLDQMHEARCSDRSVQTNVHMNERALCVSVVVHLLVASCPQLGGGAFGTGPVTEVISYCLGHMGMGGRPSTVDTDSQVPEGAVLRDTPGQGEREGERDTGTTGGQPLSEMFRDIGTFLEQSTKHIAAIQSESVTELMGSIGLSGVSLPLGDLPTCLWTPFVMQRCSEAVSALLSRGEASQELQAVGSKLYRQFLDGLDVLRIGMINGNAIVYSYVWESLFVLWTSC